MLSLISRNQKEIINLDYFFFMFSYNFKLRFCVYSQVNFALDNKLYNFASTEALQEITLLQFMHHLRINHNFIISSIEIPRFCYHHLLSIAANCRMCLIEEVGAPKLIVSCANVMKNNATYFTMNQLIRNVREHILEYLLLNHPLDCPICDQGGECDLQDITKVYGLDNSRYFNTTKKAVIFKDFVNFFIKFKMTRCIHCTRCIRFFTEILDINLLGLINRGFSMKVSYFTENLHQYKATAFGNVVDICPVGALTLSNTEDRIRAWELIQKYTIDVFDSFGSDIRIDWSGSDLFRVLPCINQHINDSWITDLTRFSYSGLKVQRLTVPFICAKDSKSNILNVKYTEWASIFNLVSEHFFINKFILKKPIIFTGLTGIFSDSKSILSLKSFLNYLGSSNIEATHSTFNAATVDFRKNYLLNIAESSWDKIRILILIGIDLRIESPLLFIKVNKHRKNITVFYFGSSLKVDKFVQHVGLGLSSLCSFFEGKHYLSNYVFNALKNYNTKGNCSQSIPGLYCLIGYNMVKRKDFPDLLNSWDYFISFMSTLDHNHRYNFKARIDYGVVLPFIGRITGSELGIVPSFSSNSILLKKSQCAKNLTAPLNYNLFLNSFDDYEEKINKYPYNFFSIFIGSHLNDNFLPFFNIVLPSLSFLEKSGIYLNLQGLPRFSKIVTSNIYGLSDWVIISLLYKKFSIVENFFKFSNFSFNNLIYINSNLLHLLLNDFNLITKIKKFFYIDLNIEKKFHANFNNFVHKFLFSHFGLPLSGFYKVLNSFNMKALSKLNKVKYNVLLKNICYFILYCVLNKFNLNNINLISSKWKTHFSFYFFLNNNNRIKVSLLYIYFNYYIYLILNKFYYSYHLRLFLHVTLKRNFYSILFFNNNYSNKLFFFTYYYFKHLLLFNNNLFFFRDYNTSKKLFFFKEYFFNFNFFYILSNNTKINVNKNYEYTNIFFSENLENALENKLKLYSNLFSVTNNANYYYMHYYSKGTSEIVNKNYYYGQSCFKYDLILPAYKNLFEANHVSRNSLELQSLLTSYNKFFSFYK